MEHLRDIERFWLVLLPPFLCVCVCVCEFVCVGPPLCGSQNPQTSGTFSTRTRGQVLSALANTGNEATLATDTVYAMISAAWSKARLLMMRLS